MASLVDKAYKFLLGSVAEARRTRAVRLPAVTVLSRACGVSPVTMLKAVRRLKREAVIEIAAGASRCAERSAVM